MQRTNRAGRREPGGGADAAGRRRFRLASALGRPGAEARGTHLGAKLRRIATLLLAGMLLVGGSAAAWAVPPVMVQDYEREAPPPTVWVVNIPNENAAVQLLTDRPFEGLRCLKLHYHFTGQGGFQYLGVPNKVNIQTPIHTLRFLLRGDNSGCSYGIRLLDADGETHQYKAGTIDFTGWKRGCSTWTPHTRPGTETRTAGSTIHFGR